MKNIFGTFTSEDDEREYEEALEKDLENNHLHRDPKKLHANKNEFKSSDILISKDIIQAKKFQG